MFRYKRIDEYGEPRHINSVRESPFIDITDEAMALRD